MGIGAGDEKNQNDGATGPTKKFDDIFRRVNTMHQRDRQTDGRTDRQRQTKGHRATAKTALAHSLAR